MVSDSLLFTLRKFFPCMFNSNLQRKPPDCHDKHLQIQTKPPYDILLGGRVGLTSLERRSTKLRNGFLFEVIFGTVFLISQPQGWELRDKGIQRRLALMLGFAS